ncbi:hypothetical protein [Shewanella frigidimarina]|uniref:hypothetical protein n=1 Tax=Shewanella frigidimarina TaxID=56812 RepID=UPI003D7BDB88
MKARTLIDTFGQHLIGRQLVTGPMGGWASRMVEVTELNPDPNAPEIVFNVKHENTGEEIGVFDDEWVFMVDNFQTIGHQSNEARRLECLF